MPVQTLSETERQLMQLFWQHGEMTSEEVAALVADRDWKATTLLTFLSRLAAKGMLHVVRQGRGNLYRPLVSEQDYRLRESRAFLDELYSGSYRDFLAAMVDAHGLNKEELEELRRWLNEQEAAHD